jgi:hypothetical protein
MQIEATHSNGQRLSMDVVESPETGGSPPGGGGFIFHGESDQFWNWEDAPESLRTTARQVKRDVETALTEASRKLRAALDEARLRTLD